MIRPPSDKLAKKTILLLAAACALLGMAVSRPFALDIAFDGGGNGGHAVVQLGFASLHVTFDSGQACPNPDSCARGLL
ncbi:MAG: hypothetical protein ABW023_14660 [Sphingomonas sp.]